MKTPETADFNKITMKINMAKEKICSIYELKYDEHNFNKHTDEGLKLLEKSVEQNKFGRSILVDKDNNIIAGNGIVETARKLGKTKIRVVETSGEELVVVKRNDLHIDSKEGRELALADNATSAVNLQWNEEELAFAKENWGVHPDDWGVDVDWDKKDIETPKPLKLHDVYIVPPLSVLDTRKGYWQERKKIWKNLIGDEGETRLNAKNSINRGDNWDNKPYKNIPRNNVSILDPVMAELSCRWFGVDKGNCFDPFAGDSVFGFVSSYIGMNFTGIELREEQAKVNNERTSGLPARYICDDSRNILSHIEKNSQDFMFSCPPYFNLEVYSDDKRDISTSASYEDFINDIECIFSKSIECLKDNRFAVVIVGDVRDKKTGRYYCFPDDIKNIFAKNGMVLYNDIVLLQQIGQAVLRANAYMRNRKVVKVHENVLVFYKGKTSEIKNVYPKLSFKNMEDYASEDMES